VDKSIVAENEASIVIVEESTTANQADKTDAESKKE